MSANTSEANNLAGWLDMVASQADDGRKKDPKDKRRAAANLLRAQSAELASLRNESAALRARCDAAEKDAVRYNEVRKWSTHDHRKAITRNLYVGVPFDRIVDEATAERAKEVETRK